MEKQLTEQQAIEERAKYVAAFNDTMIKIWQEQITLLGVIDTGQLLRSPVGIRATADGKVSEVHLSQAFLEYGLWQDYGTGKEVPRGNSGDLGKPKVRKGCRVGTVAIWENPKCARLATGSLGNTICR